MNTIMKNWKASLIMAAAVLASSCDYGSGETDDSFVMLRLECEGITKVTGVEKDDEDKVNSITYYIFDEGGRLEASVNSSSSGSKAEVKVKNGQKDIYALVNCPDRSAPENKKGFLESVSFLVDNLPDNLVMIGSTTTDIEKDMDVSVNVIHMTGKIVIKEVAVEFEAGASDRIKIDSIYLINVNPSLSYGGEESSKPEDWFNKMRFSSSTADVLLSDQVDSTIMNGCSYLHEHRFYAYPNSTEADVHGGSTFTPRFTRLVISTDMGFYSINLPGIKSNTAFIINKVTISHPGSSNPDDQPDDGSFTVDLYIKDWTSGAEYTETI